MKHVRGLRIDWDAIEGDVNLDKEFEEEGVMVRADILRDWLFAIEALYEAAVVELQSSLPPKEKANG